MERTLTFSVLGRWHFNTVGLCASHQKELRRKRRGGSQPEIGDNGNPRSDGIGWSRGER